MLYSCANPKITRVQTAREWTASVHTLHMPKPDVTRVQRASVHTLHMPKPKVTRGQSATEWTAPFNAEGSSLFKPPWSPLEGPFKLPWSLPKVKLFVPAPQPPVEAPLRRLLKEYLGTTPQERSQAVDSLWIYLSEEKYWEPRRHYWELVSLFHLRRAPVFFWAHGARSRYHKDMRSGVWVNGH